MIEATNTADRRVALVTGATRGIGAAVARRLAALGHHVIAVGRTEGALSELDDAIGAAGGSATLVPLDLRDGAAIDGLGAAIHQRWGRLDVLVGNAGVLGGLSPVSHITPKAWDEVLAVNLSANWRLIRAMEPLLRVSPAGRAVFVTSGVARNPRPFWGAYAASKAALESLVLTWAAEVAHGPVRVNLFNPGATRTAMRARAMPGEDPTTLPTPDAVAAVLCRLTSVDCTMNGDILQFRDIAVTDAA